MYIPEIRGPRMPRQRHLRYLTYTNYVTYVVCNLAMVAYKPCITYMSYFHMFHMKYVTGRPYIVHMTNGAHMTHAAHMTSLVSYVLHTLAEMLPHTRVVLSSVCTPDLTNHSCPCSCCIYSHQSQLSMQMLLSPSNQSQLLMQLLCCHVANPSC